MASICNHFARVSLAVFGFLLPQWLKLKNLVRESIAQDLETVLLTENAKKSVNLACTSFSRLQRFVHASFTDTSNR